MKKSTTVFSEISLRPPVEAASGVALRLGSQSRGHRRNCQNHGEDGAEGLCRRSHPAGPVEHAAHRKENQRNGQQNRGHSSDQIRRFVGQVQTSKGGKNHQKSDHEQQQRRGMSFRGAENGLRHAPSEESDEKKSSVEIFHARTLAGSLIYATVFPAFDQEKSSGAL